MLSKMPCNMGEQGIAHDELMITGKGAAAPDYVEKKVRN